MRQLLLHTCEGPVTTGSTRAAGAGVGHVVDVLGQVHVEHVHVGRVTVERAMPAMWRDLPMYAPDADLIARQRIDLLDVLQRMLGLGRVAIAGREGAAPARDRRLVRAIGSQCAFQPVVPVAHRFDDALLQRHEIGLGLLARVAQDDEMDAHQRALAERGREARHPPVESFRQNVADLAAHIGIEAVARDEDEGGDEAVELVAPHEQAHAREYDNLRRLAIAAAPDVLGLCAGGGRLDAAWKQAVEFAADEAADGVHDGGLHLASALLKVARLATGPIDPVPASALYHGDPIAERVRRLVDPPAGADAPGWPAWARAAASAAIIGAALLAVPWLHDAAERLLKIAQ